jgi:hypothetical protein
LPTNVVLARVFAAAALHALEAEDDDITTIRLIVSELVTALIDDGAERVVIDVVEGDSSALRIGSDSALPALTSPTGRIVDASLGVGLDAIAGRWLVPLRDRS